MYPRNIPFYKSKSEVISLFVSITVILNKHDGNKNIEILFFPAFPLLKGDEQLHMYSCRNIFFWSIVHIMHLLSFHDNLVRCWRNLQHICCLTQVWPLIWGDQHSFPAVTYFLQFSCTLLFYPLPPFSAFCFNFIFGMF